MHILETGLAFDDVLLVPAYSEVLPRDVSLKTQLTPQIALNIPFVSACMDTVTESRLAISLAQEGGMGILHKNMSADAQSGEVRAVKKFENGVIKEPITVNLKTTVRELQALARRYNFSGMPVVEGQDLLGIVTNRDVRFAQDLDQPISSVMTPKSRLVTVKEGASKETIMSLLHAHRIEKILVVNDAFQLRGMVTVRDILKAKEKPQACKDERGCLRVGAAVGTGQDTQERVQALVAAEVDVLVIDTAHGHSKGVINVLRWIKKNYPDTPVIVGNIATADGAKDLVAAGADAVKVGIGPGSICTTRIVAGVGFPQFSAIANVAQALKDTGIPVIADGGIRFSGDVVKALAAGASSVMMGSLFAGTDEAPGETELYQGRSYKTYRGMGSLGAMSQKHGSGDRYFQEQTQTLVPQGIEGRVPFKGPLVRILTQLIGGVRAGTAQTGFPSIQDLRRKAKFVRVTGAGMQESHVHNVVITKEAPNYRRIADDE